MGSPSDLGTEALHRIAKVWQVDDDRVVWSESGFDWWPGSYKVSVQSDRSKSNDYDEPEPAWRLVVRTGLATDVDVGNLENRARIATFAALTPTYAMVYAPTGLAEKCPEAVNGTLWLQSTVYLRADMAGWLPEFFARMAILQPIDAQRQGDTITAVLHGKVDESTPIPAGHTDQRDEILAVAETVYAPFGREPSRWAGKDEFEQFVERYGRNDVCFGDGDSTGLTLETPFGDDSTLIRLITEGGHPWLGNGLVATLTLPGARDQTEVEHQCARFNYVEATSWTGIPQLGSWAPKQLGERQYTANGFFVPNALYGANVVANASFWQMGRARWIKNRFFAELPDSTIGEILETRWSHMNLDGLE